MTFSGFSKKKQRGAIFLLPFPNMEQRRITREKKENIFQVYKYILNIVKTKKIKFELLFFSR